MRRSVVVVCLAGCVVGSVIACRGATEIVVDVRTNVPCTDPAHWRGIAIYTGGPGLDVETKAPVLTTTTCDASGHVGSLAIVPSGAKEATVGIRIVAGITRPPEECGEHAYEGCIVARRTLAFIPHDSLSVDVSLTSDCVGLACDAVHTCLQGACQDARLTTLPPTNDAGLSGPTVRCGDNGVRCATTGNVCCLTVNAAAGTTTGACMPPEQCPPTSATLRCDDEADCEGAPDDAGHTPLCCVQYNTGPGASTFCPQVVHSTECLSYSTCVLNRDGLGMCDRRQGCQHGAFQCQGSSPCFADDPAALPGYFYCEIPPLAPSQP